MANDLNFYYANSGITLPQDIKNGNLYFVLNDTEDIASLFLDIENQRYEIKPIIEEATVEKAGLLSKEDKKKLAKLKVDPITQHPERINIGVNSELNNRQINFLDYVYIKNDQVLTANSIQKVEVEPVVLGDNDNFVEPSVSVTPIEGQDGKFYLKLKLPIPKGDKGGKGDPGPQGKSALIGNVTANIDSDNGVIEAINGQSISQEVLIDTQYSEEDNKTDFNFNFPVIRGRKGDKGDQGIKGDKGDQGRAAEIQFRFHPTSGEPYGRVEKIIEDVDSTDPTAGVKYIYDVYIPRGEKGEMGRPFRIDHYFESYNEMIEALNNDDNLIKYGDFILLQNDNQIDNDVGKLYYYSYNKNDNNGLIYITDMSPVQPEFIVGNTTTLNAGQPASVNISYRNNDYTKPYLNFSIPQGAKGETGKTLLVGNGSVTVNKNIGTPSGTLGLTSRAENNETYLDLDLNLENLGTDIDINAGLDPNKPLTGTPDVTISKEIKNNKPTFSLLFSGIKGENGTAADTFSTDLISANHYTDSTVNNGSPKATVTAFGEGNQLGLDFKFYNLKGADGNLTTIDTTGDGNAITSIENLGDNGIQVTKGATFVTQNYFDNYFTEVRPAPIERNGILIL